MGIIVFGGIAIIPILPGKADFLGNLYAFGAMLSFTIAHVALLKMRAKYPDRERPYKSPWNVRIRGYELPVLAVIGGTATFAAFLVVAFRNLGGISYAGFGWLLVGAIAYPIARRRMGLDLTSTVKVEIPRPVVERETEYDSIIVWFDAARFNEDTLATAVRLAARTRRSINVLVTMQIPNSVPLDAKTPELKAKARAILDQATVLTKGRATGEILPVRAGQEGARDRRPRQGAAGSRRAPVGAAWSRQPVEHGARARHRARRTPVPRDRRYAGAHGGRCRLARARGRQVSPEHPPTPQRPGPPITVVRLLAITTAVIGVAMIVLALLGGGGLGSYGVLVGAFFVAAGVARLRLIQVRSRSGK